MHNYSSTEVCSMPKKRLFSITPVGVEGDYHSESLLTRPL